MGSRFGFPIVHLDCDFKIPSRMGEVINLTVLIDRVGRYLARHRHRLPP